MSEERARRNAQHSPLYTDLMANDDEYSEYNGTRQRRVKIVAWVVIVALILVGGGATVLALFFG